MNIKIEDVRFDLPDTVSSKKHDGDQQAKDDFGQFHFNSCV
jgi:hypothetical protein